MATEDIEFILLFDDRDAVKQISSIADLWDDTADEMEDRIEGSLDRQEKKLKDIAKAMDPKNLQIQVSQTLKLVNAQKELNEARKTESNRQQIEQAKEEAKVPNWCVLWCCTYFITYCPYRISTTL